LYGNLFNEFKTDMACGLDGGFDILVKMDGSFILILGLVIR
jgi:hypothetical protein